MATLSSLLLLAPLLACGDKDPDDSAVDADNDGFDDRVDCDDLDADINPAADEICDGLDNDCDGLVDDADDDVDTSGGSDFYLDADFDGFGDPSISVRSCAAPAGYTRDSTDCDDGDDTRNPDAPEVCDEIDNDCDGAIDEDAGGGLYYSDVDGDGYGDDSTEISACTQPEDTVAVAGDCDDGDDRVFPGATEICDGIDNDCDSAVDGEGLVALEDSSGNFTDLSDSFAGTRTSPAALTLTDAGTVWLCDGNYYVNIDVRASVDLRGRSGSADAVVLNGAGAGTVVEAIRTGANVGVYDLTLTGGYGDATAYASTGAGGALACEVDATVTGSNLILQSNDASYGGAVHMLGCDLTLSDSVVDNNAASSAAGGMSLIGGSHVLDGVDITNNFSSGMAGGMYANYYSGPAEIEATDVVFDGNEDINAAGALYAYYSAMTLKSTSSGRSAFTNNTSRLGYGVGYLYPASSSVYVTFDDVDFGTEAGGDDNDLPELYHGYYGREYVADDEASFTCDYTKCGSSTNTTLGSISNSVSMSGRVYGNIVEADEYATIDYFAVYIGYVAGCTADMYILSTETAPSGSSVSWDVEWSDTNNTITSTGWLTGSYVSLLAEPGMWYAYAVGMRCSSSYDYMYYSSTSGTSVGYGRHVGYVSSSATYSSTYGSTATLTASESAVQFYMYVGSTEL